MTGMRFLQPVLRHLGSFERAVGAVALASVAVLTIFISSVIARAAMETALNTGSSEARSSLGALVLHGLAMYKITAADLEGPLEGEKLAKFDAYVRRSILSERVAHVVIWSNSRVMVYSDARQAGPAAPRGGPDPSSGVLNEGRTSVDVTSKSHVVAESDDDGHERYLEIYTPLYLPDAATPSAVLEFYQPRDLIVTPLGQLRRIAVGGVGGGLLLSFIALMAIVRNRTRVISAHRDELELRAQALEQSSRVLRQSEERFRALVARSSDATVTVDVSGHIAYASPKAEVLWGRSGPELLGKLLVDLVPAAQREAIEAAFAHARGSRVPGLIEFDAEGPDGATRQLEASIIDLIDEPAVRALVLNCHDVSERKRQEEQLAYMAFHDPLTALGNRALLAGRFEALFSSGARDGEVALLTVDLDRLKLVNDSLGHPAGDAVIVEAARRLEMCVPGGWTVARFGGDEFAILTDEFADPEAVKTVAQRICESMRQSLVVEEHTISVSSSVGFAIAPVDGCDLRELLRRADTAMYRAKSSGRGRWLMYDPELDTLAPERLALEAALHCAVEADELRLCFQPQFSVGEERLCGFEALVRWMHPTRGLLLPADFIPLAEETGDILAISRWVIREAARAAKSWEFCDDGRPVAVAVNVTARDVEAPDFVPFILGVLNEFALPPRALKLELTESMALELDGDAAARLQEIREAGVSIALDDFGTGYSSLSYLQRLRLDTIKIDRGFVMDCHRDAGARSIMQGIVALARALGMDVIAEGVEDAEQLTTVGDLGVDMVQGFYYSAAVHASDAEAFFDPRWRSAAAA